MPFYTYVCNKCEDTQEIFHLMSEIDEERFCGVCEGGTMQRQISDFVVSERALTKTKKKTGEVVEEFIKSSTEDLQKEKENLERARKDV